ncbi:BON domain-containing protein [Actinoplanes sp. NPDC048967]|uniref:BON domain-containing protein n=1 Tax=Actinoplanes sp. NPDC048967 TaxID=3155269 RepID=UPI0033C30AC0
MRDGEPGKGTCAWLSIDTRRSPMMPFPPFDGFPESTPSAPRPLPAGRPMPADRDLALLVADRLRAALPQPGQRIVIEVQNRVVVLEGLVTTPDLRRLAHELTWRTPGVLDVCNRLACWDGQPGDGGWADDVNAES